MSSPYTQPSLSGYNASPPADDGSQVSSNQVTWAKHKTKLADPIKTYAAAIDSAVLAAFGLVFGAAVLSKSSAYTVATSDRGRFIYVTGTTTITLLSAVTAGSGFPLLIVNNGVAVVTVAADGSEEINGSSTITLNPGDGVVINSDGANWFGIVSAGTFTGSFTANWTGFTTSPTTDFTYSKTGNIVTLFNGAALSATSSATTLLSGADVPEILRPAGLRVMSGPVIDDSVAAAGLFTVSSTGIIRAYPDAGFGFFSLSGTKGFTAGIQLSYITG